MKLSELKFKVITGTEERNRAMQEALFAKGGAWRGTLSGIGHLDSMALVFNHSMTKISEYWFEDFAETSEPEVTFQEALDLIAQVEVEPKCEWVEFDVDEDGCFYPMQYSDRKQYTHSEHAQTIVELDKLKAYGGTQYIEPDSGRKSAFVGYAYTAFENSNFVKANHGNGKPVYPHKVRFWVEAEQ